jgi:hypothetical protein
VLQVDGLAISDQTVPPARPLVLAVAVLACRVRAGRERMADEDGVRAIGIQRAEGLIDDRERRHGLAMLEPKPIRQHELFRGLGEERIGRRHRGGSIADESAVGSRAVGSGNVER